MDICAGCFFSCSTTEYLLLLRVLINSGVTSSLTLFFLYGSSSRPLSRFFFFPWPLLDPSVGKHVWSWSLLRFLKSVKLLLPLWLKLISWLVTIQKMWWGEPYFGLKIVGLKGPDHHLQVGLRGNNLLVQPEECTLKQAQTKVPEGPMSCDMPLGNPY